MRFPHTLFHVAFHVFDDDNSVVYNQSCGQGDAKQGEGVNRKSKKFSEDESANQRDRNGDSRNDSAAPALKEQENH